VLYNTDLAFALWAFISQVMNKRKTQMTAPYDAIKAWHLWTYHRHLEQPDGSNPALDAEYEKAFGSAIFKPWPNEPGEPWVEYAKLVDEAVQFYFKKFLSDPSAWESATGRKGGKGYFT